MLSHAQYFIRSVQWDEKVAKEERALKMWSCNRSLDRGSLGACEQLAEQHLAFS